MLMKTSELSLPEVGLIAFTRVLLGIGIGLLVSDRLNRDQRDAAGWTLLAVGVISTFPLAAQVFGKRHQA